MAVLYSPVASARIFISSEWQCCRNTVAATPTAMNIPKPEFWMGEHTNTISDKRTHNLISTSLGIPNKPYNPPTMNQPHIRTPLKKRPRNLPPNMLQPHCRKNRMMQKTKRGMIDKLHYQPRRRIMSCLIPQHALPQRLGRIAMLFWEIRLEL